MMSKRKVRRICAISSVLIFLLPLGFAAQTSVQDDTFTITIAKIAEIA